MARKKAVREQEEMTVIEAGLSGAQIMNDRIENMSVDMDRELPPFTLTYINAKLQTVQGTFARVDVVPCPDCHRNQPTEFLHIHRAHRHSMI